VLYDQDRLRSRRDVRRVPKTIRVSLVATLIALVAGWFSMRSGLATAYPDAVSHASIARRIWDAHNAGFGQLGTVWLPVPHLLLAPLTAVALLNEDWWRAGLPSVVLSSLCMGVAAAALYRILYRWQITQWWVIVVALGVYVLNPSNLYVHTTALTEPVLMAAMAMSAAGLSGFLTSERPLTGGEVAVYAGLPAAAAAGSRYDGWVFAAVAALMLLLVAQSRWHHWRYSVRVTISLCFPSALLALWWVLLNATQYGDLLAFQRGPYSASALQEQFAELDLLPTEGSLAMSMETYSWTIWYVLGPVVIAATVAGLVAVAVREPVLSPTVLVWVLLFPLPYHLLSLVTGQSVIWHPHSDPPGLFNVRYALPLLIPAALAIGYGLNLAGRRWPARAVLPLGVGTAVAFSYVFQVQLPSRAPVVMEARAQLPKQAALRTMIATLRASASPADTVLIDETANPVLVELGWDFSRVIGRYDTRFDTELAAPDATWLLFNADTSSDAVRAACLTNPVFAQRYAVHAQDGPVMLLRRV
jgi:hypothetical protein